MAGSKFSVGLDDEARPAGSQIHLRLSPVRVRIIRFFLTSPSGSGPGMRAYASTSILLL